jgi:hypothetical protein
MSPSFSGCTTKGPFGLWQGFERNPHTTADSEGAGLEGRARARDSNRSAGGALMAAHVAASTSSSRRTLSYRLVPVPGRTEKAAKTLGSEDPEAVGFGAHPVRAEAPQVSCAVPMCEDSVRILAIARVRSFGF